MFFKLIILNLLKFIIICGAKKMDVIRNDKKIPFEKEHSIIGWETRQRSAKIKDGIHGVQDLLLLLGME